MHSKITKIIITTFCLTSICFGIIKRNDIKQLIVNRFTKTTTNDSKNQESDTPDNTEPNYRLPEGSQSYFLSHGNNVAGPKAKQVIYEPLNIKPGDKQTITVIFPESEIVNSAVIFITTDNAEDQKIKLTKNNQQNIWTGSWSVNDFINHRYKIRYYFLGQKEIYNNIFIFI